MGGVREKNREDNRAWVRAALGQADGRGWPVGRAGGLRSKNSRHEGRECGGVVRPRTVRIPEWLEGGGERWSVVRPQQLLCGISPGDLGCIGGPGESVEQ